MERLTLHNRARNATESVRPDLWPDHAWVPALGRQGARLVDVAGGKHADGNPFGWNAKGIVSDGLSTFVVTLPFSAAKPFTLHTVSDSVPDGGLKSVASLYGNGEYCGCGLSDINVKISTNNQTPGDASFVTDRNECTLTHNGSSLGVYVNGEFVYSVNPTASTWQLVDGIIFNGLTTSVQKLPSGDSIYSVQFSSRLLTPSQIRDLSADPMLPFRRRVPVVLFASLGPTAYDVAATFGATASITPTAAAAAVASLTASSTLGASILATAGAQASMAAGATAGAVLSATAATSAALSAAITAGASVTSSLLTSVSMEVNAQAGMTPTVSVAAVGNLTLDATLGYSIIAAAAAQAGLPVAAIAGVTVTSTAVLADLVTPSGRTITVAVRSRTIIAN